MATNEQQRRAIGNGNTAQRQGIGTGNAAQRRNIQAQNTAERRGSSIQDDLNRIMKPEKKSGSLSTLEPRGGVAARRGSGTYSGTTSTGTGGGVASPLTEQTSSGVANRDYWPVQMLATTDGLLVFEIHPLKTLRMKDANGADVVFNYAVAGNETE